MATYPNPQDYSTPQQLFGPGAAAPGVVRGGSTAGGANTFTGAWKPGMNLSQGDYRKERLPDNANIGTNPWFADFMLGSNGRQGTLPNAEALFKQGGQQYYPGQTVTGFTGSEFEGQKALTSYASNGLRALNQQAGQGMEELLRGGTGSYLGSPTANTLTQMMGGQGNSMIQNAGSGQLSPYYQSQLQGQYNDMGRDYQTRTNNVMDNFDTAMGVADDQALLSGNFGGSRGGVARGIVGKEAMKQLGLSNQALSENMAQGTADVMNQQFSQGRDAQLTAGLGLLDSQLNAAGTAADMYGMDRTGQLGALGQLGSVTDAGLLPGEVYGAVGQQQRDMLQANMNEQIDRFNFNQQQPYANLDWYANQVGSMGGYGGLGYRDTPATGSPWSGALGGAMAGAGTGAMIGMAGGPAAPFTATAGAIGGGLIGGIGGYLAQRR